MRAVTRQPVRKWWMQQAAGLSCLQRKTAERHRERSNKKSGESKARQRGQLALQEELKSPLAADRRQQQSREPRRWSWSGGRAARQAVGSWWRRVRRRWRLMAAEERLRWRVNVAGRQREDVVAILEGRGEDARRAGLAQLFFTFACLCLPSASLTESSLNLPFVLSNSH